MVKPSAEAMLRSPVTANSLPITITTIQAGTTSNATREIRAEEISNLSAIGSSNLPRVVTWCRLRAK